MVSLFASLGQRPQWERRRAEAEEASARAGFVPVFADPPLDLDLGPGGDLPGATRRITEMLPGLVTEHGASIVVSPSPHDVHHGHEAVGRGVERALAALPAGLRWWMWGLWGELPVPNVYYGFDEPVLTRALHVLDAYYGELARNDYRRFLAGRAAVTSVTGSERVFGFGAAAASTRPYAEVLTEVRLLDGRFLASEPHQLDEGPEPAALYDVDLTAWIEGPSARQLVGPPREARAAQ